MRNLFLLFLLLTLSMSCEKESINSDIKEENTAVPLELESQNVPKNTNIKNFAWVPFNGSGTYTKSQFVNNFGNVNKYGSAQESRNTLGSGHVNIKLAKNKLGQDGGIWADINVEQGQKYELKYRVKFPSGFDWARGGKLPGLSSRHNSYTGCKGNQARNNGDGWSTRVMWRQYSSVNNNTPYFEPYAYYKDMVGSCGNDFGKRFFITTNKWYEVNYYIKMNTGSNSNGTLKITVNGNTLINKTNMRFCTSNHNIGKVMWHVYRGGGDSRFTSPNDHTVKLDYMRFNKLN